MKNMKKVIKCGILLAITITVAMSGCKKEDNFGKGEGKLSVYHSGGITNYQFNQCYFKIDRSTNVNIKSINFKDKYLNYVIVNVKDISELTAKTYTVNDDIERVRFSISAEQELFELFDSDEKYAVMEVAIKGNTYEFTITGKTGKNEFEYTMYYKGTIHGE